MLDQSFYQKADEIIAFYGKKPASLIPIMQDIQGAVSYTHLDVYKRQPLDVVEFHNLMKASYLIMTDSGGIQEEAPALGKPVPVSYTHLRKDMKR